ncbi:hypothetical protein LQZ24_00725 [Fructobacillus sp. M1-13]|nr:hypothetical protein [Fructobacillus papyriferae]MCD2158551.1 hypothetical protein [Fructobacillus papyriferae]
MAVKAEEQQVENLKFEHKSILPMKKTFSGIKELNIKSSSYDQMTGFYSFVVVMINQNSQSVKFDYSYSENDSTIGYYSINNEEVQKEGVTTSKVMVTYSDGEKEVI